MNCERCGAHAFDFVADVGGMRLMRCTGCAHQQLVRAQEVRGMLRTERSDGVLLHHRTNATGNIVNTGQDHNTGPSK